MAPPSQSQFRNQASFQSRDLQFSSYPKDLRRAQPPVEILWTSDDFRLLWFYSPKESYGQSSPYGRSSLPVRRFSSAACLLPVCRSASAGRKRQCRQGGRGISPDTVTPFPTGRAIFNLKSSLSPDRQGMVNIQALPKLPKFLFIQHQRTDRSVNELACFFNYALK